MGKLSILKYAGLCVLGAEVAYTACMFYGLTLSGRLAEFHLTLFELLPGFNSISLGSWLAGAITIGFWSAIAGAYVAWMHNASLGNK